MSTDKISQSNGQRKSAGHPDHQTSRPTRHLGKASNNRPHNRVPSKSSGTASAEASPNRTRVMPRQRDYRFRDATGHDGQIDDLRFKPTKTSSGNRSQIDAEQHSPPADISPAPAAKLLSTQGPSYRPPDPDDELDELWIETGEHEDEYSDFDDEGVQKLSLGHDDATPTEDSDEESESVGDDHCEPVDAESSAEKPIKIRDLMRRLRRDRGVFVSWRLREIVASGDQAIVLGQILYWFDDGRDGKPRARIWRYGRLWFYKLHEEFALETGLKPRQVRACLNALEIKGFIVRAYFRADGQRTTHISLNLDAVYQAMVEMHQKTP
jgi:hypothetical protein